MKPTTRTFHVVKSSYPLGDEIFDTFVIADTETDTADVQSGEHAGVAESESELNAQLICRALNDYFSDALPSPRAATLQRQRFA